MNRVCTCPLHIFNRKLGTVICVSLFGFVLKMQMAFMYVQEAMMWCEMAARLALCEAVSLVCSV